MMTKHQLYDAWSSLVESTHDLLCEAEDQENWPRAYALRSLFFVCWENGIALGQELSQ